MNGMEKIIKNDCNSKTTENDVYNKEHSWG